MSTDDLKPIMGIFTDHDGKRSNIRVLSIVSMFIGGVLAIAPFWGAPETNFQTIALFVFGGPGLKVWQAVGGGDPK